MATLPVSGQISSPWLLRLATPSVPALRLVAFPFAGGSGSMFRRWVAQLPPTIALDGIQLPGRENRLREAPIRDLPIVVQHVVEALLSCIDDRTPLVLFGHSLGALLAFEVTRALRWRGVQTSMLVVSGHTPPRSQLGRAPLNALSDEELIVEVRRMDGIPEQIAENRELLDLILPALRGDLAMNDCYEYRPEPLLSCRLLVLGGQQDGEAPLETLDNWSRETTASCSVLSFPGGHFFLETSQEVMLAELVRHLQILTPVPLSQPSRTASAVRP